MYYIFIDAEYWDLIFVLFLFFSSVVLRPGYAELFIAFYSLVLFLIELCFCHVFDIVTLALTFSNHKLSLHQLSYIHMIFISSIT